MPQLTNHSGGLVDLGNGRLARAGVLVDSGGNPLFSAPRAAIDGLSLPTSTDVLAHLYSYDGSQQRLLRAASVFKNIASIALTSLSPTDIWTPASGKRIRLLGFALSLSVAGSVILKFGAGSTELLRTPTMVAGDHFVAPPMGLGMTVGAANDVLKADVTSSGTVSGFVFGTEE